ncbi:mRNA cleavage and polyadenylation factor subunit [Coemansia sp. RSA 1365]|nr:mRNA cleavage and polyadenylation factor subunit [Coemansia sp. RSA 1365]
MRDPVYSYCRELVPPSVVERAVSLSFTRPRANNLALARGNLLEIYEVELAMKRGGGDDGEVPGDDYMYRDSTTEEFDLPMIRDDTKRRGASDKFEGAKQPQLRLAGRWSLHGKIIDMQPVRSGSGHGAADRLILSFAEAKMSLIAFDSSTQGIVTESIHYYEHDSLRQHTPDDAQTCTMRADPERRCIALRLYGDQLAILPFAEPGAAAGVGAKPYTDSFVVDMREGGVDVRNVRDFVFLGGYLEPTLALLHEQAPSWAGRVEDSRDTCSVTVVSLDVSRRSVSVLNSASRLPYDCQALLAVPDPLGGVLALATSSITHVANGTVSCISVLSHAAVRGIGESMMSYLDRTNISLELSLEPRSSEYVLVGPSTVALWTQCGHVFLLRLSGTGRLVKRIVARQVAGPDAQQDAGAPAAHTWDDIAVLPSCVSELRMTGEDESGGTLDDLLLFVGGNSGRSLLISVRDVGAPSGGAALDVQSGDEDGDIDIDAELYGDAAPAERNGKRAQNARDVGPDRGWADAYRFAVCDEILGSGTVVAMDVGTTDPGLGAVPGSESLQVVTCVGNEWRGSLCVQQRHIQPEVVASFDLPGAPVRGVWTARCLREYNIGGVMQAVDSASLGELGDTFMVLSRDASTAVFAAGNELQELDRTGFFTDGPTVVVGELLGHTRVVQVHMQGLRVVNAAGRATQAIDLDPAQQAVYAQVMDPFVLLRMRSGELCIFEASPETGLLSETTTPDLLKGTQVVAASLFEDAHRALCSNKEWAERNKDALDGQQQQAEDGSKAVDEGFDSLYAEAAVPRKRKRTRGYAGPEDRKQAEGLYDEEDNEYDPTDTTASVQMTSTKTAPGGSLEEGARPEEVGGETPVYLLLLLFNGDLTIMRLPQFDRVWTTPRFDLLLDTLVSAPPSAFDSAGPADARPIDGASSSSSSSEEDNINGANETEREPGASRHARHSNDYELGKKIDQFQLMQLGGDCIVDTYLVALTSAGEIAVYRAFAHCSQEYIAQHAAAASGAGGDDDLRVVEGEVGLALRFSRMQHDVLAYEPDYEQKVRRVQTRQAQAFAAWSGRNKQRVAEQLREEKEARTRAQEKRQQEEAMAVADWGDGSEDDESESIGMQSAMDISGGAANAEKTSADITFADLAAVDDLYADESEAAAVDDSAANSHVEMGKQDFMSTDTEAHENTNVGPDQGPEAKPSQGADAVLDEDSYSEPDSSLYPLESTSKFTRLDNIGGYAALFVSGVRPVLVLVGPKRWARVHPLRLQTRLAAALQPADAAAGFDAEAAGLVTGGRPLIGMARYHAAACAHGVVVLTQGGTLVVATLATSAQSARGGIEFDAAWPVRTIPAGTAHGGVGALGGVAFHARSGCYALAAAGVARFGIREPHPDVADRQAREMAEAQQLPPPRPGMVIPEHERAPLATTSAPPRVPRFSVDLLSSVTWETIDSHALEPDEHIAVMRVVALECAQAAGDCKPLLCVGTGFVLGEDVQTRGKVYVFDVIDVVPLPGRPATSRRLKLLYSEEVHGVVSALTELRGCLAMSIGSKVFVRSFAGGEALVSFAFLDCQCWVRSLTALRSFLLVGDLRRGLWLVGFQEHGPARLLVLARDAHACMPIQCAEVVALGHQLQLLAADAHGHLHFFTYAPHDAHSFGGQRLLRRGEYALGSHVVALRRLAAPARLVCLAATASGAVHAVSMLPENSFKRLHRINLQLVHGIPPPAALNPREFRAVPLAHRHYHAPRRSVLDADLLVPLFAHGPLSRQRDAAQRDGTTADRVLRDIVDVEHPFNVL